MLYKRQTDWAYVCDYFLVRWASMCFRRSKEPSQSEGSFDYHNHVFLTEEYRIDHQDSTPWLVAVV